MAVKITARKNGPFRVETTEGEVILLDAEGGHYDLTGKPAFWGGGRQRYLETQSAFVRVHPRWELLGAADQAAGSRRCRMDIAN